MNQFRSTVAPMQLNKTQKFFAICGGSTIPTLAQTNADDQQKRITAGVVVVVIAAISGILASKAWSVPMGIGGYLVGIPWFAVMLLLERSILQQMDAVSANKICQEWLKRNFDIQRQRTVGAGWLIMRFIMIGFICYFNSEMVRVVMFKPEIVAEIKLRQNSETRKISDSVDVVRKNIKKTLFSNDSASNVAQRELTILIQNYNGRIDAITDSIALLSATLPHEVEGPGGISGKTGDGPVAKSIRESIVMFEGQKNQLISQRDSAKSGSVQANALAFARAQTDSGRIRTDNELTRLDKAEKELIQKVIDRPVNGLAFMLEVLNDIAGRNMIIWAVFFMFFFIEAIPVLLKFFSKSDSFTYARALQQLYMLKDSNQQASEMVEVLESLKKRKASMMDN